MSNPSYYGHIRIPVSDWPAGLCKEIATIDPIAVDQYLGSRLIFERDHDDLDAFSAAIFVLEGVPFALQLYDNVPGGNYTLIVMSNMPDDGIGLARFLAWSGIPEEAVTWRRSADRA